MEYHDAVERVLEEVWRDTAAQAVMVLSLDGQVFCEMGSFDAVDQGTLGALLGHGMAAFYELTRISQESEERTVFFFYQDETFHFACTSINEDYFLATLFHNDGQHPPPALGMIWFYSKRACEQLQSLLQEESKSVQKIDLVEGSTQVDTLFNSEMAEPWQTDEGEIP